MPIDFYVEAPDNIGGFIRYYEIPELIRVAAPIYLKFGLRNSPDIYPCGTHIENTAAGAVARARAAGGDRHGDDRALLSGGGDVAVG